MAEAINRTVCVLLLDDNKILLIKNMEEMKTIPGKEPFKKESKWGMPRGRREEKDKDDIAAGEREGKEETGYEVEIDERYRVEESAGDHTMVAFIGYPAAGKLNPDPKEIADAHWVSRRALWVVDPNDKDYIEMHPRQRRMAQKLLGKLRR